MRTFVGIAAFVITLMAGFINSYNFLASWILSFLGGGLIGLLVSDRDDL